MGIFFANLDDRRQKFICQKRVLNQESSRLCVNRLLVAACSEDFSPMALKKLGSAVKKQPSYKGLSWVVCEISVPLDFSPYKYLS